MATLGRKYAVGQALPDSLARLVSYRMNAVRFEPSGARTGGVIAIGGPADLVEWAADPFLVPRSELEHVGVRLVINAGRLRVSSQSRP